MMQARAGMVQIAGGKLAIASTVATRYSAVRRQGFMDTSQNVSYQSKETQIIDYQIQLFRLMKQVATAYAIKVTGRWMNTNFEKIDQESADLGDEIAVVHATAAGLKGLCVKLACDGIEDCRKACGGHGYLLGSGVAALAADYVWQCTAEGDFVVMLLQTARFLMKSVEDARAGKKLTAGVDYLAAVRSPGFTSARAAPAPCTSADQVLDLEYLLQLFRSRALVAVYEASSRLKTRRAKPGMTDTRAWQETSLSLAAASRAHCLYFMLVRFVEGIKRCVVCEDVLFFCVFFWGGGV